LGAVTVPLTHYVIVRTDLPLGLLAAQIVHAAGESAHRPLPPDTHAVVLAVPDEVSLRTVATRLSAAGIEHHLVCEPDAPWYGQAMAIGVCPRDRGAVRRCVSDLPLLRDQRPAMGA
jgi:hypothetical protein